MKPLPLILLALLVGCSATPHQPTDPDAGISPDQAIVRGRTFVGKSAAAGDRSGPADPRAAGQPTPRILLTFHGPRQAYSVETDPDGRYQIALPPGRYSVTWQLAAPPHAAADTPRQPAPAPSFNLRLKPGQTYTRDIQVTSIPVDPS